MQIEIQARHFSLTDGPRGGADKCCHLQVVLAGLPDVVVENLGIVLG